MLYFRKEPMREGFDKWHIGGLPYSAVIHIISIGDIDGLVHSHPFTFRSYIMFGSYLERIYTIWPDGTWSCDEFLRQQGDSFTVYAHTIHEIVALSEGEAHTIIFPEGEKTEWGFYQFGEQILYRQHDQEHFKPL